MYKQASQLRLRFDSPRGPLTTEQLWDLSLTELDKLAVHLEDEYKNSKGKSFLDKKTKEDKTAKLRFDIALDVLQTKVEEAEASKLERENKEHNRKILDIIANKQDKALEGKSVKELEKMLR